MSIRTISRQNEEIDDLTKDNRELRKRNNELAADNLKYRVANRALLDKVEELQGKKREDGQQNV